MAGFPLVKSWFVAQRRSLPMMPAHVALRAFLVENGESVIAELEAGIGARLAHGSSVVARMQRLRNAGRAVGERRHPVSVPAWVSRISQALHAGYAYDASQADSVASSTPSRLFTTASAPSICPPAP